jgi:hypothetical protein
MIFVVRWIEMFYPNKGVKYLSGKGKKDEGKNKKGQSHRSCNAEKPKIATGD